MSKEETPRRMISIRPRAAADIERHAEYLEENTTPDVARRFRSAIMQAIEQIGFMPGTGAPREVRNQLLAGLRMKIVPDFRNYLIFYLTPEGNVEISVSCTERRTSKPFLKTKNRKRNKVGFIYALLERGR